MTGIDVLVEGFGRIRGLVHGAVEGLTEEQLAARVGPDTNTIAWLVWHLARVQDDHIADAAGGPQIWTADGWVERFDLPLDPEATGYGQRPHEVAKVIASGELLAGYYDAVHERTLAYLKGLSDADLNRVVDNNWDPPVTLGVRLVSVLGDDLQHCGQAAYARGMLTG